ncbi:MAG: ClbS/DfsB family four-helix bundle protein [bacterium]|nr:ClbS/DfsB family four-helix bundle protein [bacterium]
MKTSKTIRQQIETFDKNLEDFIRCIKSLSKNQFIKKINGWSSRDILAHLIGWNYYTISGAENIRRRTSPDYLSNPGENFSKVNAELVRKYASPVRRKLLAELKTSSQELKRYMSRLDPSEWNRDFGVKWEGSSITIRNTIDALINDYVRHRKQIEEYRNRQARQ